MLPRPPRAVKADPERPPSHSKSGSVFVYVFESQSLGIVKIGKSREPEARLSAVRRASGLSDLRMARTMEYESDDAASDVEKYLLRSLWIKHDSSSHRGEWLSSTALQDIPEFVEHKDADSWLFRNSKRHREKFKECWSEKQGKMVTIRIR